MPTLIPTSKSVCHGYELRTLALLLPLAKPFSIRWIISLATLSGLQLKQCITHVLKCDWPVVWAEEHFYPENRDVSSS